MKQLIDIGNPDAPHGSESWCRSFHQVLCKLKREGQFAVSNLKYSLIKFRDEKYYETLTDDSGQSFKLWEDFVQYREPYGLGMLVEVVEKIINEPDDNRLLGDVLGKHGRPGKGSNTTFSGGRGRDYIIARLERDGHSKLASMVMLGSKSANEAAIEVGYKKKPEPFRQIKKLLPSLTKMQRRSLWKELCQEFANG